MKKIITGFVILVSTAIFAAPIDNPRKAMIVQNILSPKVLQFPGVNGIAISGCNPRTGELDMRHNFVHCVVIFTETVTAATELLKHFPVGYKFDGVYIAVKYIGKIGPQPGMTVGN